MYYALLSRIKMLTVKLISSVYFITFFIPYVFCQVDPAANPVENSIQKNLGIARVLIEKNKEDSALIYLNFLLSKKYDHEEALMLRAKIYNNKKLFDKALIDYNALVAMLPENKEVVYARGVARQELRRFRLAIQDYEQAIILPNGETQTAFFKMESGNNMTSGISTINQMENDIWNNIGLCYIELAEFTNAISAFNKGITIDNNAIDLYINRAIAHEKNGAIDLAIKDYEFVLSKVADHPMASFNLINLRKFHQQNFDLINSLNIYISENPNKSEGFELRGLHYFESKQYELAMADFTEAVRLNPDNVDNQFNLALSFAKTNRIDEAERIFLTIIEIDPTHSSALFNVGNIHFKLGNFESAITYFTLAHQLSPNNKLILYNRALSYFESGQKEMACLDMKMVMTMDEILAESFYTKYCSENH